jgi:hypothetical protein
MRRYIKNNQSTQSVQPAPKAEQTVKIALNSFGKELLAERTARAEISLSYLAHRIKTADTPEEARRLQSVMDQVCSLLSEGVSIKV